MIYKGTLVNGKQLVRALSLAMITLVLAGCLGEVDDTTGSRLVQPPVGSEPRKPVDIDDIAIVGQEVAHAIMNLDVVANATTPPMVQFTGVTSIVKGTVPVDTEPYTELLRDRLLLLTREKLRFVERTLPPLVVAKKKSKKQPASTPEVSENPDYQILAELRGKYEDDLYKIQIQFVDTHSSEVLFDGLYRIRKEGSSQPLAPDAPDTSAPDTTQAPQPPPDSTAPPAQTGSQGVQ